VVVVPRLVLGLGGDWADTALALPDGEWTDVLTGATRSGRPQLHELLADFPVAVLARSN
jgi:(1->4)-alpha-D-glucan 1-alpha-D-glucosylmutase